MKAAVLAMLFSPVLACLWDSDTLEQELLGVPEARDLVVTGRWIRHGPAYYERRVRDASARLAAQPKDLEAYEDLAVAKDRLGDPDGALAVMERKAAALETCPDARHRYRLLANRGTFHAHAGRYAAALADLEAAVALNADAHFGREKFQIALVRYLGDAEADPSLRGKENFLSHAGVVLNGAGSSAVTERSHSSHRAHLEEGRIRGGTSPKLEWAEAHAAVAAMLRLGGGDDAEIYRVLGDLYLGRTGPAYASDLHLAWWSYRRALDRGHPARSEIEGAVTAIERHWNGTDLSRWPTAETFARMKASGDRWLSAYQAAEAQALVGGDAPVPEVDPGTVTATADAAAGPPPATSELMRSLTALADAAAGSPPAAAEFQFKRWFRANLALIVIGTLGVLAFFAAGPLRRWCVRAVNPPSRG